MPRHHNRFRGGVRLLGTCAILALTLTACAQSAPNDPQSTETPMTQNSPAISSNAVPAAQTTLERVVPLIQAETASAVDLEVVAVREESCLRIEIEEQQTETRWVGSLQGVPADAAAANAALDSIRTALEADGWTLTRETDEPENEVGDVRVLIFQQGDMDLSAVYARNGDVAESVEILATTDCTQHPTDHQMLRSELDPEYGISSRYYPDGA